MLWTTPLRPSAIGLSSQVQRPRLPDHLLPVVVLLLVHELPGIIGMRSGTIPGVSVGHV